MKLMAEIRLADNLNRQVKILLAIALALIGGAAACFYIGNKQHQEMKDWLGISFLWTEWHSASVWVLLLSFSFFLAAIMLWRRDKNERW